MSLDQLCIDTIRTLSIDGVQKANSGHPGLPMGAAPMAYVLWSRHLKHNPADPKWIDRDRFVLSGGHGSMLLYSLLHLTGYSLSLDELKKFSALVEQDVYERLTLDGSLRARNHYGATSPEQVRAAIVRARSQNK